MADQAVTTCAFSEFVEGVTERLCSDPLNDAPFVSLLQELCRTVQAERAFVIQLRAPEGSVLWSVTIDGDPVPEAQRRIPEGLTPSTCPKPGELLTPESAGPSRPPAELLGKLDRKGVLLARIDCSSPDAVLFLAENRFCSLNLHGPAQEQCRVLIQLLALGLQLRSLRAELAERTTELQKAEALLVEARSTPGAPCNKESTPQAPRVRTRSRFKEKYSSIVTCSPRMYSIFSVIDKVAHTSAPVLITGESGTGKELIARAIHDNSPRASKPFVPENCAALTETLLESELFGYVKGAFTGATTSRKGLLELADGGTLFLDEVGEMSLGMQKKLLRVLQEGVIRPVGGKEFIPVDVRIISATNKDLVVACAEKAFREDLLYRLNVITLQLPPLRERGEDIPLLVEYFLAQLAGKERPPKRVSPQAMALLRAFDWPGNVRQLQNEVQRLHTLAGEVIEVNDISPNIRKQVESPPVRSLADLHHLPLKEALAIFEREFLLQALKRYGGNKTRVARELGIPKTSLYNKLQRYGLKRT